MIAAGVRSIKYCTRSRRKCALFLEMHACIGHHVQTNGQAVASVVRALMGSEGPNRGLALTARLRFHNPRSVIKGVSYDDSFQSAKGERFDLSDLAIFTLPSLRARRGHTSQSREFRLRSERALIANTCQAPGRTPSKHFCAYEVVDATSEAIGQRWKRGALDHRRVPWLSRLWSTSVSVWLRFAV
jgi:hypothetical protein